MHSRHLTLGSLALVAVIGIGSGLLPAAAAAPGDPGLPGDPRGCGQPEIPAQWGSIEHPAVTRLVPALTRSEWRWQRSTTVLEREYVRESAAAVVLVHWTRTSDQVEREYAWTVVDRPAEPGSPEQGHTETRVVTPAVTVVEMEYVQQQNGTTRWEREGWNAGDKGKGWTPTGLTRTVEVKPAVTEEVWVVDRAAVPAEPEQSYVETAWVADGTTPPAASAPTSRSRVASSSTEEQDLPVGQRPAGTGWVEGATFEISAAEEERIWLPEGAAPAAGFTATGATRSGTPVVETTAATSALPPAGEGWTALAGSAIQVVVEAAHEVVVKPAWVEDFIVVPAQPVTPACSEPGNGPVLPIDEGVDPPVVVPMLPEGPVPSGVLGTTEVNPIVEQVVVTDGAVAPATAGGPSSALPSTGA
ncbi:hypothetical protein [Nocardioides daeguensis]|uniref:Uncharacterized protein n=1 Tax=Nocardioides daeguensis TaxID=908359 RepID=A0ABP6WJ83_9ACTN|nr:hypothetical protein [Nocardioides daeguensis]MBV6727898.1 hypothetical protein [Nocardioides daeguensis]MCR1775342.1 hypothetical protein [Nocardioides daeguensis]